MTYHKKIKIRKRPIAEINVVPYIDVMLVLLVIFMIVTPMLTQGVQVNLPPAAAKALPPKSETPIIVSVDNRGDYYLNIADNPTQPIAAENLMVRVAATLQLAKQNHQQRDVYVKGDNEVDYGKVVRAMVLLQQAGADSIGLITKTPKDVTTK